MVQRRAQPNLPQARRRAAALLGVLMLAALLLSVLCMTAKADHVCTAEDCPICACIQQAERTLKQLGSGAGQTSHGLPVQRLLAAAVFCALPLLPRSSLTSRKVKLNN